jgi:hypothetical protein
MTFKRDQVRDDLRPMPIDRLLALSRMCGEIIRDESEPKGLRQLAVATRTEAYDIIMSKYFTQKKPAQKQDKETK